MYRVRLINKGVGPTSPQHPVCGKSGKLYGQAVIDYARGGPVFEMSAEDYERDKHDIIGNTKSRQQWVPEFYECNPVVLGDGTVVYEQEAPSNDLLRLRDNGNTPHSGREKLQHFNELRQRAKAAGIWRKGMKLHDLEAALLTIPD